MFTWLPLSARALTSCPSTTRLNNASGPTQCMVGPSLKREEAWHMVATCAVTSMVVDLLGRFLVLQTGSSTCSTLYLVKLWQLSGRGLCAPCLRIWWEQLLIFEGSNSPHGCWVPPLLISLGIGGSQPALVGTRGLPHLQLLGQCIQSVKACICLFPLREVSHSKA